MICMGSRSVLQKHDIDLEIEIALSVIQTEMLMWDCDRYARFQIGEG